MWSVFIKRTEKFAPYTFSDLLKDQEEWFSTRENWFPSKGHGVLLLSELDPVITLGTRQLNDTQKFEGLSIKWAPGDRGGNETWHGLGQWVGFVITPLEQFTGDSKGVRKSVYKILNLLLPLVQEYLPDAKILEGEELGIWTPRGKVVSVGIKVRRGWMNSGFSVNVFATPESFLGINPCGVKGAAPDYLLSAVRDFESQQSGFIQVGEKISKIFESQK